MHRVLQKQQRLWHRTYMSSVRSALLTGLVCVLTACATTPPNADQQTDICQIFDDRKNWYRSAAKAQNTWGTSIPLQMAIIKAESSFDRNARPARGQRRTFGLRKGKRPSSARGFSQALDGTWDEYKTRTGNSNAARDNFADATDFIGWYTSRSARAAGIGINDARSQYLAYHEGPGGFTRGTWRSKQWLINVADRVATDTTKFGNQLARCEKKLKRRGLFG